MSKLPPEGSSQLFDYARYGARVVCSKMPPWMRGGVCQDIAQETFMILSGKEGFMEEDEALKRRIAYFAALDTCRRNPRMLSCLPMRRCDALEISRHNCVELGTDLNSSLLGAAHDVADVAMSEQFVEYVRELIPRILPPKLLKVVTMRFHRGMRRDEVAEELGISSRQAGRRMRRAARIIRKELALRGYSGEDCLSAMEGFNDGPIVV